MEQLVERLWNPYLLGFFLITGLFCSLKSGFFQFFDAPIWLRHTIGTLFGPQTIKGDGISPFKALATALASTVGTGSIAGVATAIWFGGAGAVFWMWMSAFLGMMTSYVEKLLSVQYRRPNPKGGYLGGPMYYLRDGLKSPFLATWFAIACLPATLAGGNLVQSASISTALHSTFGIDKLTTGIICAIAVALVMLGGIQRISTASATLVPIMAVLYLGSGCVVLFLCYESILPAFSLIFSSAFTPTAAIGGGIGYTLSSALRYGVARGVFTNEAGLGTSAMAHAAARCDTPAQQGLWGILEVFLSTLVVCTMTALVILVSGVYCPQEALSSLNTGIIPPDKLGAPLTAAAFTLVLGPVGGQIVALSLLLFAFSSILGWSYYGEQAVQYLLPNGGGQRLYRLIFLITVIFGSVAEVGDVWLTVDLCNALLAIPNLIAILLLCPQAISSLHHWIYSQNKRR